MTGEAVRVRRSTHCTTSPSLTKFNRPHPNLYLLIMFGRLYSKCTQDNTTFLFYNNSQQQTRGWGHRLRRWPNTKPTLGERVVLAGIYMPIMRNALSRERLTGGYSEINKLAHLRHAHAPLLFTNVTPRQPGMFCHAKPKGGNCLLLN